MKSWPLLTCLLLTLASPSGAQSPQDSGLWVDQVGYRPGDPKFALAEGDAGEFRIVNGAGAVVLTGNASPARYDANSRTPLRALEFSGLTIPGTYTVVLADGRRSAEFRVDDAVYRDLATAALTMLRYQRCGTELDATWAGDFAHAACHLEPAEVFGTNRTMVVEGGWHDAGDYGRYVVPGAVAVGHLLLAEELWPGRAKGLLEEARYEIEWLLRMQDASGGVYHKVTSRNFPGLDVAPDFDFSTQVVSPVSWTATADFAAVLAASSRLYRPTDRAFADLCLASARRAERWTQQHAFRSFANPQGIQTGEYGDTNGTDEALWMNVELLRATGEAGYAAAVRRGVAAPSFRADAFGWADTGLFSVVGALLSDPKKLDAATRARAQVLFDERVADLVQTAKLAPDRTTLRPADFHWGSNMTLMDHAMLVAIAHRLQPPQSLETALEDLHALLGRNAVGRSFVTGFGTASVLNPHHRPSVAAGVFRPVPGMVSGGPNTGLEDPVARSERQGAAPSRSWLDDAGSYSTNEVAIYWNTPLIFVLAGLD